MLLVFLGLLLVPSAAAEPPPLHIEELMASNAVTLADADGDFPDWIEIHNGGAAELDLAGYGLSDDPDDPAQWTFPSVVLPADGRLVVFASGKDHSGAELHTSFKLSSGGETLVLTMPGGATADAVTFGALPSDISYGRSGSMPDAWRVFDVPTPGALNGDGFLGIAGTPTFGVPEGHSAGPVTATVAGGADETLRYALGGRVPTIQSEAWAGPLTISTTGVLRVRAFRDGYLPGPVATATYLIGEPTDLPAFALVAEPSDLFGSTGIYGTPNWFQDLEVPGHLALAQAGEPTFSFDGGLRLHGGFTRSYPQKSLRVVARGRYGTDAIRHPLFPDLPYTEYQALILRNSGQDWYRTMLADGLMQTLVENLDLDGQEYRPAVVYLNGAYWGIQNLREKINEHYVARRHGVDPDEIDMLEYLWGVPEVAVIHGDAAHYQSVLDYVEPRTTLSADDVAEVESRVELDNFIDYHAAQIYFNNTDWPGNNLKMWRPRTPDGRWRWLLFDTDTGFGYFSDQDTQNNTLAYATDPDGDQPTNLPEVTLLLRRLLTADPFRDRFVNRFADFFNSTFEPERVVAQIDSLADGIRVEIPRHQARWPEWASDWEADLAEMRGFAQQRPAFMAQHLRDAYSLGALAPVTVRVTGAGHVRVNRLTPTASPWTGDYFAGTLVPLEAVPAPGAAFEMWSDGVTEPLRFVDPADAPDLTARFGAGDGGGTVVVSEVQYNAPDALDSDDWIELTNTDDDARDLGGWTFSDDDDTHIFEIPAGTLLAADGFVVLCRDAAAFAAAHPGRTCLGDWDFGLGGSGDQIRLFDADGALVDAFTYTDTAPWPPEADGDGSTLELIDPASDNALAESWGASVPVGGTPGATNSIAVDAEATPTRSALRLAPAFPNPVRREVTLRFTLPASGPATLRVYDALGREVASLSDVRGAGAHDVTFPAASLPSGVYLVRLQAAGETATSRFTVVR